jgi:hypothetical protein
MTTIIEGDVDLGNMFLFYLPSFLSRVDEVRVLFIVIVTN